MHLEDRHPFAPDHRPIPLQSSVPLPLLALRDVASDRLGRALHRLGDPITTVPARIVHSSALRLTVSCADRKPERIEISRLPEFVSEEFNPGNGKRVTRIVVELPSSRLRDGITPVDTPGLGSLATAGAAETLAYLPRCDLGVVLIDAGSTLTTEDLATLRNLYEAAIPARVLSPKPTC